MSDKWQPWVDYDDGKPQLLPIAGPPCPGCKWWMPVPEYRNGNFGVRLCHSKGMRYDFSCFEPKPVA